MTAQHTPGPWKVKAGTNAVLAGRKQICSHVNAASALPVNMLEDQEIAQANARLIAAAPDLLEALKGVLKVERGSSGRIILEGWHEEAIRAAIAKATGGV